MGNNVDKIPQIVVKNMTADDYKKIPLVYMDYATIERTEKVERNCFSEE